MVSDTAFAAPVQIALFEPDIPQNTGAILRTAACLGCPCHLIEPAGFVIDESRMRRAGMDYLDLASLVRHESWSAFIAAKPPSARLIASSTRGASDLPAFRFQAGDIVLMGRESAGLPESVWQQCDASVRIPLRPEARSLNVAQATAILTAFALNQLAAFPTSETQAL